MSTVFDLDALREGLVLSLVHDVSRSVVELVSDLPWAAQAPERVFARIVFEEVQGYQRVCGNRGLQLYGQVLRLVPGGRAFVIQGVRLEAGSTTLLALDGEHVQRGVEFDLGVELGSVRFTFRNVRAETRTVRARPVGNKTDWEYFDTRTGSPVDFYEPFAGATTDP